VSKVWCNARANATAFYEKFGMVITPKKFKKGGLDFVVMERSL
jgi:predicted GNAT family N-acyltransferase